MKPVQPQAMPREELLISFDEVEREAAKVFPCPDCCSRRLIHVIPDPEGEPQWPEWHVVLSHDLTCPTYRKAHARPTD